MARKKKAEAAEATTTTHISEVVEPPKAAAPVTPIKGYRQLSAVELEMINEFKNAEEELLRALDKMVGSEVDQRWLSIGRTHLEQAFMAINRSIAKPGRVVLAVDLLRSDKDAPEAQ